jgi:hypothetical protein
MNVEFDDIGDWDEAVNTRGPVRPRLPRSLETDFRQLLGEMEVWMSYGPAMNLSPTRGGDGTSGRPSGEEHPAHLHWRERWERAFNKQKVCDDAREALEGMRHQKRVVEVPETQVELETRIVGKCREGWTVEQVANECRCTTKLVRAAWAVAQAGDRESENKRRLPKGERAERVQAMRAEGLTMRQIGMLLKVDPMTVHRDLAA